MALFVELVHNCLAQVQAGVGNSDETEPVYARWKHGGVGGGAPGMADPGWRKDILGAPVCLRETSMVWDDQFKKVLTIADWWGGSSRRRPCTW